ncbi:GAF domain-containing sensor histidine kinase [Salegentibacter sp. F188]|uniref:histidine kinase n=1 Tax=Autumnicola patrickiae TaxID=3075591 RepID=A0ABU3E1L3_9FLAO|nr:GAF domain-containing sensor histidine kinase [Salegentibacter sp. F188]MDT0689888.1 GAF domain-containing sensor histidine kinase [Salegentibacter sp. F188]
MGSITEKPHDFQADIDAVNRISIVPSILDVICRTTGMGFAVIARVTEDRWLACSTKDELSFGLKPGDELKIESTFCHEVRQTRKPIVIDHVDKDDTFCNHPTPSLYGFQSYISIPIYRKDNSFFGTLCALDPKPNSVNTPEIIEMFKLFADLLSFHLDTIESLDNKTAELAEEREVAELREKFIAILGHDLRNPLGTIRMCSDLLLQLSTDERSLKYAATIKSTSYRMQALIDNMLDFARGHLGDGIKLNKMKDCESLEKTLEQVLIEIAAVAPEQKIKTKINLTKAISCDEERIAQLFSNLLGNAIKHGDEGQPISVKAYTEDGNFKLAVSNAGEKISSEVKKHLFEPFYRQHSESTSGGLGLGLYISSEIAKAHGGEILVESTKEETTFTFVMPYE